MGIGRIEHIQAAEETLKTQEWGQDGDREAMGSRSLRSSKAGKRSRGGENKVLPGKTLVGR